MKAHLIKIFILFTFLSCAQERQENVNIGNFPKDIKQAQIAIVASLSGNQEIKPFGIKLNARATEEERALSRAYLIEVLNTLTIDPIEQPYTHPNVNSFVDLLIGPFTGINVYGIIPATKETNEYVVLGAHYDTARNCPGANDNASAIAMMYAVARKIAELKSRELNLLVVFFDQEEEELIGSKAFVGYLKKKKFTIHSVHTIDQMGWDADGDRAIELELPTEELELLYKKQGTALNIPIYTTKVNSTDHQSFREVGYNAVGITEEYVNRDTSPFKDNPDDTFETVNFDYLASTTNLVYEVFKLIISKNSVDDQ